MLKLPVHIMEMLPRAPPWHYLFDYNHTHAHAWCLSFPRPPCHGGMGGFPACFPLRCLLLPCFFLWASCTVCICSETLSFSFLPLSTLFQGVSTWGRSIKPALLQLFDGEVSPGVPWFGVGG